MGAMRAALHMVYTAAKESDRNYPAIFIETPYQGPRRAYIVYDFDDLARAAEISCAALVDSNWSDEACLEAIRHDLQSLIVIDSIEESRRYSWPRIAERLNEDEIEFWNSLDAQPHNHIISSVKSGKAVEGAEGIGMFIRTIEAAVSAIEDLYDEHVA